MSEHTPTAVSAEETGHPRRWLILGILTLSLVQVVASVSSMNLALPAIQSALEASASAAGAGAAAPGGLAAPPPSPRPPPAPPAAAAAAASGGANATADFRLEAGGERGMVQGVARPGVFQAFFLKNDQRFVEAVQRVDRGRGRCIDHPAGSGTRQSDLGPSDR